MDQKAIGEKNQKLRGRNQKLRGAIFDMDGTLLDSMTMWDTAGETYLHQEGARPQPGLRDVIRPMSLIQTAEYIQTEYGLKKSLQEIMDGINGVMARFYAEEVRLKDGVQKVLDHMKDAGVKMCLATATDRCLVEEGLKHTGIDSYFQQIFTCTEVGAGKEYPDIYVKALEALGTEREATWVFEDALYAAKTACRAGFPVAAVYDVTSAEHEAELKAVAERYIYDWKQLKDGELPLN